MPTLKKTSFFSFSAVQNLPQQNVRPTAPVNPYKMQNPNAEPAASHNNNNGAQPTLQNPTTSFPFRFSNPQAARPAPAMAPPATSFIQQQQQQNGTTNHVPPFNSSYSSRFPFMQPSMNPLQQQQQSATIPLSTATTTTTTSTTVSSSSETSTDKNWQDGLRALLPNINISFASKSL